jgi:DNA-binding transcriptional MocR family regulator
VESPTFYGLLQVLESLGLRALEIPTSPQTGISLEALQLAADTYGDIKAVVVVPHLQNPLGSVMPDANKQGLLRLCEERGIALIEDDTYSALVDSGTSLPAIKSWDTSGQVIHCASLHKILAPGMRLGWMAAGRWQARVEMLKYAQTRNNEGLSQIGAGQFMATGAYDRHLRRLRGALATQRERTAEAIAHYFPPGTRMNVPPGGLQLWVELPGKLSVLQLGPLRPLCAAELRLALHGRDRRGAAPPGRTGHLAAKGASRRPATRGRTRNARQDQRGICSSLSWRRSWW